MSQESSIVVMRCGHIIMSTVDHFIVKNIIYKKVTLPRPHLVRHWVRSVCRTELKIGIWLFNLLFLIVL